MAKSKAHEWLTEDKLIIISAWARDGLSDLQIANNIGIVESTFYAWKNKHKEFSEALKKGKEVVDIEVENALLKRAMGYKEILSKQKVTKDGDVVDYEEEVCYPPDITALIYWLKNRKPATWRDKQEIEHSGTVKLEDVL